MKKIMFLLMFLAVTILSLQAQKVSSYTYHLDNGITVKNEKCWNNVWVDQRFDPLKPGEPALALNVRTLGDFSAGSSFKLFLNGKEAKVQGAKPGTYTLKMTFKLSGKPGTLTFDVNDILIRAGNKTNVSLTLYEYQILIDETPGSQKGLAYYESRINRYKGSNEPNPNLGIPTFYLKGKHDNAIPPDEKTGEVNGKIKPGTYDVLITINIAGKTQKIWLENFVMKPDVSYKITSVLNCGGITYSGGNREVKALHLYPAGTAARQTGTPAPDKNMELIRYETPTNVNPCSPGSYDVLLNIGNGVKYEWRPNLAVKTGGRTDVK
jgi:hypothetical protein